MQVTTVKIVDDNPKSKTGFKVINESDYRSGIDRLWQPPKIRAAKEKAMEEDSKRKYLSEQEQVKEEKPKKVKKTTTRKQSKKE
jgi:hypothetical protein